MTPVIDRYWVEAVPHLSFFYVYLSGPGLPFSLPEALQPAVLVQPRLQFRVSGLGLGF